MTPKQRKRKKRRLAARAYDRAMKAYYESPEYKKLIKAKLDLLTGAYIKHLPLTELQNEQRLRPTER